MRYSTRAAAAALCLAALTYHGSARAAPTDPLFAGAHARLPHSKAVRPLAKSGSFNFSVSFEGGVFDFPASLTLGKKGVLSGTVTAPSGCPGTVNAGSTDTHSQLNLQVTFGGACNGEPGSFVGTLKFKKATGAGTFTDPYASGPYTVS